MKKILIYSFIAVGCILTLESAERVNKETEWISICHNPCSQQQHTIWVPMQAASALLSHGDEPGECWTTNVEYILSHSPDPFDPIFVDDYIRIYVNGSLIGSYSQSGHCCPPLPPIHFIANTGDVLRIQAQDANECYSLDALWLQKATGSCLTFITGDIYGPNCGSEIPNQIFFDETFILP